jgi:hypothetical protein
VTALAQALQVPFGAHREQHNYTTRARRRGSGQRVNAVRNGGGPNASARLTLTDYILALRLRDHLNLPVQVIAILLGIDPGTASHATTLARELLATARITPRAAPPPASIPRTPAGLLAYAAAAGIPLTIPENGHAMPERFRTRTKRTSHDTPETTN